MKLRHDFKTRREYVDYLFTMVAPGISRDTLSRRLREGMAPEIAISRPVSMVKPMGHPWKGKSYERMKARGRVS